MILLTLVQKSELIEATWDEVDFEEATWTIPKQRMKTRRPHVVYLSRQAFDIFVALHTRHIGQRAPIAGTSDGNRCQRRCATGRDRCDGHKEQ